MLQSNQKKKSHWNVSYSVLWSCVFACMATQTPVYTKVVHSIDEKKEHCNGRFFPLYSLFANLFYATKFNSNTFTIIHLILYFTNKLLHSIKNNTFDIGYFQSSCWKESRKHSVHLYVCHLWEIRTGVYITVCLNKKYHLWRPFCLFIGTM